MPRRNNRDKRYEPREYDENRIREHFFDTPVNKPRRKRKDKWDKSIYKQED